MKIIKCNHNTVDVFTGIGWESWSRFKIKYGKEHNDFFQIKGNRFPNAKMPELTTILNTTFTRKGNRNAS